MRFPLSLTTSLARYIIKNKLSGRQRFPLVLMLEPLHKCNLSCVGCGRIREYRSTLDQMLTLEQCLAAVDECGAPVVSIAGGEPLVYPQIGQLCDEIVRRKKHIYLCTNGLLLEKRLSELTPSTQLYINIHLDGLEKTHDLIVGRKGVFETAVRGIKAAKAAGHMVCTNTTVYRETDMAEIEELLKFLAGLGVDGFILSPGYDYSEVDSSLFLTRKDIHEKFREADRLFRELNLINSLVYLEFLQGKHEDLPCTPWGNPTYNPRGWRAPCYLLADEHYPTFAEMMEKTPWEKYGPGNDVRCANCMMHSGFEASAALNVNGSMRDMITQIRGMF